MDKCIDCKQSIVRPEGSGGTGYAEYKDEPGKVCDACCGKRDAQQMREGDRICLYLIGHDPDGWVIANWAGTLKFRPKLVTMGKHNKGGHQYNVRFRGPDGREWWGRNIGDSQILHCKKLKATS